jgi:predicted O-methyltransferase YrrM
MIAMSRGSLGTDEPAYATIEQADGSPAPGGALEAPGVLRLGRPGASERLTLDIVLARLRRARQERRVAATVLTRLAPSIVRSLQRPSLSELRPLGGVDAVLDEICPDWRAYEAELRDLQGEIERRYDATNLTFPREYAVEAGTEKLLYALVRSFKPRIVLETGVANGHTTTVLLSSLRENGLGELHSTDISGEVGGLLMPQERRSWRFHQLAGDGSRAAFSHLLGELGKVDLFFHDSEHTHGWQSFEYEGVWRVLTSGGWLVSDDADASYAFIDFCARHRIAPVTILDRRKVIGLVRRPDNSGQ